MLASSCDQPTPETQESHLLQFLGLIAFHLFQARKAFLSTAETLPSESIPEVCKITLPQLVETFAGHDTVDHPLHLLLSLATAIGDALPACEIDSPDAYSTYKTTNLEFDTEVLDASKVSVVTEKLCLLVDQDVASVQQTPRHRYFESTVFVK